MDMSCDIYADDRNFLMSDKVHSLALSDSKEHG